MTQTVVFDTTVGGDGSTITNDSDPTTGFGNGGTLTRFFPAVGQIMAMANWVKARAYDVLGYQTAAASSATSAAASLVAAQTAQAAAANSANDALANASAVLSNIATSGHSSTSTVLGSGSHTLITDTGKSFGRGMWLKIFNDETHYMQGLCTAYNSGTGSITVAVKSDDVVGSGTFTSWDIGVGEMDASGPAFLWNIITY